jgi:hypothetical protein
MISFSQYILLEGQLEDHYINKGADPEDAKDAIARWRKLTPKQKEQVPNPQKYQDLKEFIRDLESAEKFVSKTAKQKQVKESGIKGLKEGEDYLEFETGNPDIQAYAPLNWEASKLIASEDIGSCEGKWCTAYQKSSQQWYEYTEEEEGAFIYFITPETKYAVIYLIREGIVGWELFDANDEAFDAYLTKLELPEIYPIADKMSMHYEEIREHLPPDWDEIIDKDDVKAFEEKNKKQSFQITSTFMESLINKEADKCLEWVLKNIKFSEGWFVYLMAQIMLHDDNKSKKMQNRFMIIYEALGEAVDDYGYVVDIIENCVLSTQDTDFYFDIILNDDRFYYEPSSSRKGSLRMFERYIKNYKASDKAEIERLMAKVEKRREEME